MRPTQPNVLLLHWHDVGKHLGCYGATGAPSPHVDALARDGFRFDNAFCTAPQCSPARGSLLTSLYPHRNGLMGLVNRGWTLPQQPTLPTHLGALGYRTALIGVQHESRDAATLGYCERLATDVGGSCGPVAEAARGWLHERAAEQRTGDGPHRPFYASIGFFETHRPYSDRYQPADPAGVHVPPHLPDNDFTRQDLAAFYGSIRAADHALGAILATLEETGLAEDTWVLFTSDHGIAFPGAKGSLYDPGIEVALIARPPHRWQGRDRGAVPHLASHLDLLPTVLDLAGGTAPPGLDGLSLADYLRGGPPPRRDRLYAEKTFHDHYDPTRAVRTERYKYIRSFEERPRLMIPGDVLAAETTRGFGSDHWRHRPTEELYDLSADPLERDNLAEDPDLASLVAELAADLRHWQENTHDPVLTGAVPDPLATARGNFEEEV